MRTKFAKVVWMPEDVQALRPHWSKKKCSEVLLEIEEAIEGDMISRGWESLDFLLNADYDFDGNSL